VITFKSTEVLSNLPPDDPAFPTVQELVGRLISAYIVPGQHYNKEDYGYVTLIEESDPERNLDEIWGGCTPLDIFWEGIMLRSGFLVAVYLADNIYGLVFVIVDAPWVSCELRRIIEDTADPLPEPGSVNREGDTA
jgi:hypothetical protein